MIDTSSVTQLTDTWLKLLQESGEDAALEHYSEQIIPALIPTLYKRFQDTYNSSPKYDGLISLLGFAPDTVILTYHFVQPETLVVVHTKETKNF